MSGTIQQPTTNNNRHGNGSFMPLKRKAKKTTNSENYADEGFVYLDKLDRQMRFNNAQDPIYFLFETVENRPLKKIAKDFVRDSFFEVVHFVSKVVR